MRPPAIRAIDGIGVSVEYVPETNSTFVFPLEHTFFTKDEMNIVAHTLREEGHRVFYECDLYVEYEDVDIYPNFR